MDQKTILTHSGQAFASDENYQEYTRIRIREKCPEARVLTRPKESDEIDYQSFLRDKRFLAPTSGVEIEEHKINPKLFPFQRDLVRWALRKGRSAIFADTGLGKTFMQIEVARLSNERALILAPLSVARQTVSEAKKIDVEVVYARSQDRAGQITVTNYEMADRFDPDKFGMIILDESSILKATEGATRNRLIEMFRETPKRLCCTATPAPNDIQEITNHAEFLGIMKRRDVLATFFLHEADDARASGWRLKNHARQAFWRWLASWGMSLTHPCDLGYEESGYSLPTLTIEAVIVKGIFSVPGRLFADRLRGITERSTVRRQTKATRVKAALDLFKAEQEPWIAWCGLNDEGKEIADALGDRAILVEGSQAPEEKAERLAAFVSSDKAVLVSKPRIAGFGMNFQHCARMAFVGIGDSYEQYYQAIRRCWRYGQTREVRAYVVLSEIEKCIYDNVLRKEREAKTMIQELVRHVAAYEKAEIGKIDVSLKYEAGTTMRLPEWVSA